MKFLGGVKWNRGPDPHGLVGHRGRRGREVTGGEQGSRIAGESWSISLGRGNSIPSFFWISSRGTPLVSGMTNSTQSNCPTIATA